MKQWAILAVLVVGGYVAYQWVQKQKATAGATTTPAASGAWDPSHVVANVFGPLQSGVPTYNDTPVLNRPDQLAASQMDNDLATIPGTFAYEPAFGPTQNQY